jgi:hypothetical protein
MPRGAKTGLPLSRDNEGSEARIAIETTAIGHKENTEITSKQKTAQFLHSLLC